MLLCNPVKQNTTNCSRNKFKAQKAKLWGKYQPLKKEGCFVNFVLFTRDRTLTNETQLNCFISLSYSLIYIRCVKSYSAKFVRNHSLIRYFLHFDWLLPSTDLKRVIQGCVDYVNHSMSIVFALIIWHVSRTNQSLRQLHLVWPFLSFTLTSQLFVQTRLQCSLRYRSWPFQDW